MNTEFEVSDAVLDSEEVEELDAWTLEEMDYADLEARQGDDRVAVP